MTREQEDREAVKRNLLRKLHTMQRAVEAEEWARLTMLARDLEEEAKASLRGDRCCAFL